MAKEIGPIAKPVIWLVGQQLNSDSIDEFSARVDHAKHIDPVSKLEIGGVTTFKQEKILTFDKRVRIIITTQVSPKANYNRQDGVLDSLTFEGNQVHNSRDSVNRYAETYYTLNGKEPVRTKAHLYNYLDMNDGNGDPSAEDNSLTNLLDLGFILSASPTGSDLITLKAVTYQNGNKSRVAIAKFKIARPQGYLTFENRDTGSQ